MAKQRIRVDVFVGLEHEHDPVHNKYRFHFGDTEEEMTRIVDKALSDIADLYEAIEEGSDDSDDN